MSNDLIAKFEALSRIVAAHKEGQPKMRTVIVNPDRTTAQTTVQKNPPTKKKLGADFPNPYVPSVEEMKKYHSYWNSDNNGEYKEHEKALNWLFIDNPETKGNTDMKAVIIKCSVLNDFYATNIFKVFPVAKKILSIKDIDDRLKRGDYSLVNEIAKVEDEKTDETKETKVRFNYSFATKYCSHHQPKLFPIYDRYVADVLCALKKQYPNVFSFKKREELKRYEMFVKAIDEVKANFGLENYNYKDMDRYLWLLGKEYFNPYKK